MCFRAGLDMRMGRVKTIPVAETALDCQLLDVGNTKLTLRKFHSWTSEHVNVARRLMGVACDFTILKPGGCFTYHQVLTFTNSTLCPHRVFMRFGGDLRTNSEYFRTHN
jgi:hypothetical protein